MKKLSFNDALFVRLKFQKSFQLPKSPLKSPKQSLSPFLAINQTTKQFSLNQNTTNQEIKASKFQIDDWIAKKQVEVKRSVNNQKFINELFFGQNKFSQELKIKQKQNWEIMKKQKQLQRKQFSPFREQLQNPNSKAKTQNIRQKLRILDSLTESKISTKNSVFTSYAESSTLNNINFNKNQLATLLKSKQSKQMQTVNLDLKSTQKNVRNPKIHELRGISMTQSQKILKLSQRTRSLSRSTNNITCFIGNSKKLNSPVSLLDKKNKQSSTNLSTDDSSKSFGLNPIYYDKTKSNKLIKKYENREMSPIERKDLKNKYSHLQKRLDSILRSVKTEKLNRN